MDVNDIARVCHEANRGLQAVQAAHGSTIPIADPWDDIPETMKASVLAGVGGVLDGNTPQESHEGWVEFRKEQGWVLGEVKDEEKKTHPLLVPYSELSEADKLKDKLFAAIVKVCADA